MFKGRVPVALEYTEGGVPTEPYILSTDEFVEETDLTFIVKSEPIRIQGHPYKTIFAKSVGEDGTETSSVRIPCVSPSRVNVARVELPDLDKFTLPPLPGKMSLQTKQKVWKLVGFRIDVNGVHAVPITGMRQSTMQATDAGLEEGNQKAETNGAEDEDSESDDWNEEVKNYEWGFEHAQRQIINVGCKPAQVWYEEFDNGTQMFQRHTIPGADGDIYEFGYGNQNFENNNADNTVAPIEMFDFHSAASPEENIRVVALDSMTMDNDKSGDCNFLTIERQAEGVRHTLRNGSKDIETKAAANDATNFDLAATSPDSLKSTTAGMVSMSTDIFNKSYWLNKSKGVNNGVIFGNMLYFTFVDNMRGHIYRLTSPTNSASDSTKTKYDPTKVAYKLRHIKEYQITVIVRQCTIKIESKLITQLLQINKEWLQNFGFKFHGSGELNYGESSSSGVFRELYTRSEPQAEEKEPLSVHNIRCVSIDCNGGAEVKNVEHSSHPLAKTYNALNVRGTKKGAVSKKRKT